jgi:hypothetical protein
VYYSQAGNIVLIRVPKTGSSSAYTAMREAFRDVMENGPLHETYAEMRVRIKSTFLEQQDWRIVGFVRHPLPWLNSMVAQFWEDNVLSHPWYGGGLKRFEGPDLAANVLKHVTHTPYDWFTNADGNVCVTEIYRVEDMIEFTENLRVPYRHDNMTPKAERKNLDWTPAQLDTLRKRFHRELVHYPEGL